ncbi:methyltransferase domain-containing protein [Hyalangium sp.]|uniref:methyltransferase domain-containing protein n=1 Tax=Hyalangium sp. TaxID=2028555 RepID=UPI002D4A35EA|nr:methyltransferase domain-containing protein [Hyalangium sp.]HYH99286.1 methyltransferase domain-containing protein [Hyalangium sp.]
MFDSTVTERYSQAAQAHEPGLCCPVDYDPKFLKIIPQEVLDRDYGCGDPVSHVREGETVLDLGSGGGKVCFIAAQIVGPKGKVIGVDITDDMLKLARNATTKVVAQLGYNNLEFRKGRIEDLTTDIERLDEYLKENPVRNEADLKLLQLKTEQMRREFPLVADNSVDVIISNCVLNLVSPDQKHQMMKEIYRVLKPGGRVVISDIVSDEDVPLELQQDKDLWSGCYSGAIREDRFFSAFADVGLYGIKTLARDEAPWHTVNGVEFRSVTIAAYKGKEGICLDHLQAVVFKGPFRRVEDDDNHLYERGVRMAVCEKTFRILNREPYKEYFDFLQPNQPVKPEDVKPFNCAVPTVRDPKETKNGVRLVSAEAIQAAVAGCAPDSGCC